MKHSRFLILFISCCLSTIAPAQIARYLIEAESFQFKGKWVAERSSECLGTAMLRVFQDNKTSDEDDAMTVVGIKEAGTYTVWTRSRDYSESPGKRTFRIVIDGKAMNNSGLHGRDGFYWEKVGTVSLDGKQTIVRIHDTGLYFGRCDALLLTTETADNPNEMTNTQLAKWRTAPVRMECSTEDNNEITPPTKIENFATAASISNGKIRMSFGRSAANSDKIICKTDFYANGSWRRFAENTEDNRLLLIYNATGTTFNHNQFFPAWDYCRVKRSFTLDGNTYTVMEDGDNTNPYNAGEVVEAMVKSVSKTDGNTIKVVYECGDKATITAYWTVPADGYHIESRITLKSKADGMFSMALQGSMPVDENNVTNVLLPPMFQYRRLMPTPKVLLSSMTQQPVAIMETSLKIGNEPTNVSSFVCADISSLDSWGGYDFSPIGFSLRNNANDMQPVAFSPVMGMSNSKLKSGNSVECSFVAGVIPESWNNALEYVSDNVFRVKDYRKQTNISLTETIFNMNDLMNNDEYSGWCAPMKGFWDIEANGNIQPTVVQSSPLTVVSQALLAHDENAYINRALPTIEYTLSRSGYRWTMPPAIATKMQPEESQFSTSYYCGLNEIMGRSNLWLEALALPNGTLRDGGTYASALQPWRQALAAYKLTGDEHWLNEAINGGDDFITNSIYTNSSQPLAQGNFYNSNMYGAWWLLTDLYEATLDERYLKAAQYGAAHTLAGIRSYPQVKDDRIMIHPDNKYDGISTVWWKGAEKFRLGFPRVEGDIAQHDVDQWTVSPVGLSIEQPATYFQRSKGKLSQPVMMSSWAPHLLRLATHTGKSIYNTYARNAVIGRYANYPGYYATGFTDITMSTDFPYKGPDVSSIYYHHIPAHISFSEDFLINEITGRSNGNISFPYGLQEGFAWFTNRIYGNGTGNIFGEDATLRMRRGLLTVNDPQTNYVTAVSDTHFWAILTNEASDNRTVKVTLSKETADKIKGADAIVHCPDGTRYTTTISDGMMEVSIPQSGLVAIAMETNSGMAVKTPKLKDGMEIIDTGTPAGRVYLYRIRSPFGWDSVYGVAEATPTEGLSITIECNGERKTASSYPYEQTFMKYGYDEDIDISVIVEWNGGETKRFISSFKDTETAIKDINNTTRPTKGIYNIYGIKVDKMNQPGIYIVDGKKITKRS